MTHDVIALTPHMPDAKTLLAALHAGGPDLRVKRAAGGAVVQLCAEGGQPLVSVEAPRYLQVPGEVGRLLGDGVRAAEPVWWTEVRASTRVAEAVRLAGSVAGRLTALLGGVTWPSDVAHTDVVAVPAMGDAPFTAEGADPDADLFTDVDVLTAAGAVVIHDRPVVAATTWLTGALRAAARGRRELFLVTSPRTRLTLPARTVLDRMPARWVVRHPENGYFDGLTGAELRWKDGLFAQAGPETAVAEAFQPRACPSGERQLLLSIRTVHPPHEGLLLGGALEDSFQTLAGAPPAGWATAEPVNLPWSARQLTDLARSRARRGEPTWIVAVGASDRPAIATSRITHTHLGVEEHIALALGYPPDHIPPVELLPRLAESLAAKHNLVTMIGELRAARADLTAPAHYELPPIPVSLTLGPDAVTEFGATRARDLLPGLSPTPLGPGARPALHFPLGDGTDPAAWARLRFLRQSLGAPARTGP